MSCSKTTEGGLMRRRKLVGDKTGGKTIFGEKENDLKRNDLWRKRKRSLEKKKTTRLERQDLYVFCFDSVHLRHTLRKKKRMNTATTNRSHRCLEIKSLIAKKSTMCCLISDDPCTLAPLPLLIIFQ